MILFLRTWALKLAYGLSRPLPVKRKVVLASNHSAELQGNLKFLEAELRRRAGGAEIVLLLHRARGGLLGKLATLWTGVIAEYHLATCRVFIVDDYYFPLYVVKPKSGTVIIQTWHAAGAFKKVGYSVVDKSFGATEELVSHVRIHSNYTWCLAASEASIPAYSEAFGQPAERFVTLGIPRTDVFFEPDALASARRRVVARYGIPEGKRILLYAPTFRGDSRHAAMYKDHLELETMQQQCSEDYVLLLRLHPFVSRTVTISEAVHDFAVDVSSHEDFNELLIASDLLVTDYSSAIFEYSLLERPMLFFAPDYEEYEQERGFYFDYRTGVPGPVFTTTGELASCIQSGAFDTARVREFRERSFAVADGRASERVVEQLVMPALR
jgi:CDP-ribitol ribitolphosphotransferase